MSYCNKCGEKNNHDGEFCRACGVPLGMEGTRAVTSDVERGSKRRERWVPRFLRLENGVYERLERNAWYRLLKVLGWSSIVLATGTSFIVGMEECCSSEVELYTGVAGLEIAALTFLAFLYGYYVVRKLLIYVVYGRAEKTQKRIKKILSRRIRKDQVSRLLKDGFKFFGLSGKVLILLVASIFFSLLWLIRFFLTFASFKEMEPLAKFFSVLILWLFTSFLWYLWSRTRISWMRWKMTMLGEKEN